MPPDAEQRVPDSLARHAVNGVLWSIAQKWGIRVGSLVTLAILTRQLTASDFGVVAAALVFVPFLILLSDAGLAAYVVQAQRADQRLLSTSFWFNLGVGSLLTALTYVAAPLLEDLLGVDGFGPVLQGLSPAIVLSAVMTTPAALLKRRLAFRAIAMRQMLAAAGAQVVAVVLVLTGAGVWALVAQFVANFAIGGITVWVAARWRPSLQFSPRLAWEMLTFGVRVIAADLVGLLCSWLQTMILLAAVGTSGLGYWSVATRLVQVAADLTSGPVISVTASVFARIKSEQERLLSGYLRAQSIVYAMAGPVMLLLATLSPVLLPTMFGSHWEPSVAPAQVYALASIFVVGANLDRGFFLGTGRPGPWLGYAVGVEAVTLLGYWLAAPHGLTAVAWAFCGVAALAAVVRWLMVANILGVSRISLGRPAVLALLAALVASVPGWLLVTLADGLPALVLIAAAPAAMLLTFPLALRVTQPAALAEIWGMVPAGLRRRAPGWVGWLTGPGPDARGASPDPAVGVEDNHPA